MAKNKNESVNKDLEAEVWTAITAFEQILEAMPNDRASLDALSHAYEQIGDHTRAKEYLLRYATVLTEEGDTQAASALIDKLDRYADQDPRIKEMISQIRGMAEAESSPAIAVAEKKKGPQTKTQSRDTVGTSFNMQEEMSFAWNLSEAQQITQEEYASVVQDLTDMSATSANSTVSVLHVLENRGFKNLEKIISHVSRECNTPIISISSFDVKVEPLSLLSPEFMLRRGAMAFELLGKDALVVVMNPYDKQLKKDVEVASGRKCHFFLTLPSEFDRALVKARDLLAEAGAPP